ncbi:MAG: MgtC/SapB family protein [Sphingobium sp.]|nr:MgtC/SapB family protein [Sphingobium sp.]
MAEIMIEILNHFLAIFGRLGPAFVLGAAIGFERQLRQRNAGLRTMVLVAVGAAAFVHLGVRIAGSDGAVRIIAYVVSGIGFLGAGVIMKEGAQVRGLNTAATLWSSAAVGAFCGCGLIGEAAAVALVVVVGNTVLRPLVNYINRLPLNAGSTEAVYKVHVVCDAGHVTEARDLLAEALEEGGYPIQSIDVLTETDERVELAATLIPTTAQAADLDAICERLSGSPELDAATWTMSTTL